MILLVQGEPENVIMWCIAISNSGATRNQWAFCPHTLPSRISRKLCITCRVCYTQFECCFFSEHSFFQYHKVVCILPTITQNPAVGEPTTSRVSIYSASTGRYGAYVLPMLVWLGVCVCRYSLYQQIVIYLWDFPLGFLNRLCDS